MYALELRVNRERVSDKLTARFGEAQAKLFLPTGATELQK